MLAANHSDVLKKYRQTVKCEKMMIVHSNNTVNINKFIRLALTSKVSVFFFDIKLKYNPDWIEESCCGDLDYELLKKLIESACVNERYCRILYEIIEIFVNDSMPDSVFNRILDFPNEKYRQQFLISLAHKQLNESRLLALCNTECAFECFFELAALYYTDSSFSQDIFKSFLQRFSQCGYFELLNDLLTELQNRYTASDNAKYEIVKIFAEK